MDKLCRIRDVQRAVMLFEQQFSTKHGLSLNEGMLLCSLCKCGEPLSCKELAELLGLTSSNTSKVIASVERKKLIERIMGEKDKRQMYFSPTQSGKLLMESIKSHSFTIPDILKPITG